MKEISKFPISWKTWPETPFYATSESILNELYSSFKKALQGIPIDLHYAMKANNQKDILHFFNQKGEGLDIVSGGELSLGLAAGFQPQRLIFSGVGKTDRELQQALEHQIGLLNIESSSELRRLISLCRSLKKRAAIGFRVNPDIDAGAHPFISTGLADHKFGILFDEAFELYREAKTYACFDIQGISIHIGSQLHHFDALSEALKKTISFSRQLKSHGIPLKYLDVGGGVGVHPDRPRAFPPFEEYSKTLKPVAEEWQSIHGPHARLACELGRCLVAQAGMLFTRVIALKTTRTKNFAVVDAGMNDLLRPALYQATHPMERVTGSAPGETVYDVVGPVCESSDVLARACKLPTLTEGDMIGISHAGAYGRVMASTYNARALPGELWIPR